MSAQGATLRRGTIELPIWPVAVLVVAALAAAIGMTALNSIDTIAPARTLVTVTDTQRLANSTAAVREQGAVLPVIVGISHVTPSLHWRDERDGMGFDGRSERGAAPPVQLSARERGTGARLGSDHGERRALHAVQVDALEARWGRRPAGPFPFHRHRERP